MEDIRRERQFWSSGWAARIYRRFAGKRFARMHRAVAERVRMHHPKDVLDIACGPGDFLLYLSSVAPDLVLTGTDIAPGMVKHASEKLAGKAHIVEAVGEKQPFPLHSFDAVTIMMAFHHFPNKVDTLWHVKTLLRPGGTLIIADIVARSRVEKIFWNALEWAMSGGAYVDHYTEQDLRRIAGEAGFDSSVDLISDMPRRYRLCVLR